MKAHGTLNIEGSTTSPGGIQQLFYATVEQKNMSWLNNGLADKSITGLIVRTRLKPLEDDKKDDKTRDKLTGLPLDSQGRYTVKLAIGDPINGYNEFSPKFFPCATADCISQGRNLDMKDSATQAYVNALDAQVFKDINTAATLSVVLRNPTGAAGVGLSVTGPMTSIVAGLIEGNELSAASKEALQVVVTKYLKFQGLTDAVINRVVGTVDLAGGWQAFIDRAKKNLNDE
jgi:filamentous hemagglutinin